MEFLEMLSNTDIGHILTTFFVAMVPVLELRGAIPLGVSLGVSPIISLIAAILGNMVPVPFIVLFIRRVLAWMQQKSVRMAHFAEKLERRVGKKRGIIDKWETFGLLILVAIPLPGTGAWTGALVAALLNMRIARAVPVIFAGVVIAGVIVTILTYGISELI